MGTSAALFAAAAHPERVASAIVGTGGAAVPLQLGEPLRSWVLDPDLDPYRSMDPRAIVGAAVDNIAGGVAALVDVREGKAVEAVATYAEHGRIHVAESLEESERALVGDWLASHRVGEEALMIAGRLAEAERLSRMARAELMACGEVGGPQRQLACGPMSAGDRVMMLKNDAGLGVQNGMRATVLGLAGEGGLRMASDAGAIVELPADYLEAGHLTYGYATTAHKAQGMTVERAFVLAPGGIDRQWGYTALSRARAETRIYVAHEGPAYGRDRDEVGGGQVLADRDPLTRLAADLARDRSQEAALERLLGRERPSPERGRGRGPER